MSIILVTVRLFAGPKELLQLEAVQVEIPLPANVADLKRLLEAQYSQIREFVRFGRIAIGNDFVSEQTELGPDLVNQIVALIPPVSGG